RPEQGGVDIELLEVVKWPLGERIGGDVLLLVLGCARPELIEARTDATSEVRDHAAAVVDQELDLRIALEHAREDHPAHEDRRVVLPAEHPPQLVLGAL